MNAPSRDTAFHRVRAGAVAGPAGTMFQYDKLTVTPQRHGRRCKVCTALWVHNAASAAHAGEKGLRMVEGTYHTHNDYCDGRATIAAMVQAALEAGLRVIGISS